MSVPNGSYYSPAKQHHLLTNDIIKEENNLMHLILIVYVDLVMDLVLIIEVSEINLVVPMLYKVNFIVVVDSVLIVLIKLA